MRKHFLYRTIGRNVLDNYKSSLKIKLSSLFQMGTSGARIGEKQLLHVFYLCLWALEIPHILLTTQLIFTALHSAP